MAYTYLFFQPARLPLSTDELSPDTVLVLRDIHHIKTSLAQMVPGLEWALPTWGHATVLGHGLTAIVEITLDRQDAQALAAFEQRVALEAAVQQCYRVSPGPDLVLVLWVPDMATWHALVQRLFTQDANVRNVKSFFATHRAKFAPAVRLPGSWDGFETAVRVVLGQQVSVAAARTLCQRLVQRFGEPLATPSVNGLSPSRDWLQALRGNHKVVAAATADLSRARRSGGGE